MLPADQERVRQHLAECELCSDALNGVAEMDDAMGMYRIIHDLRRKMRKNFLPKKKILYRFELITLLMALFVIGLILVVGYYLLVFWR
jgi:hypothetical protein